MLCIAYPNKSLVLNASKNGFLIACRKVPYRGQLRIVFQLNKRTVRKVSIQLAVLSRFRRILSSETM